MDQPTGPETPEEKRSRLVRESLIAHARMQVFKTHYNRNKKTYPEMRSELGEEADGQDLFEVETFDEQGNAHAVEVDEECDYSPTSAGGEVPGPVGPTPPSEPEGSGKGSRQSEEEEGSGKGGKKGNPHKTWGSLTPERMRREDFKSLKHWAPRPEFIDDEEKDKATSTSGTATTGQAIETEAKERLPAVPEGADPEWWKPGAFSQNFVFLEDAEARRPLMEEDDSQPFTEEQWNELSPWRRERIVEWMRRRGKGKGKPRYPNEPKGPHEPDLGPDGGGSSGGGGSSSSIAVRAMRVPTDSEWEMISGSSQQGTPERNEGRQDGLPGIRTEGELPGRQTEGELPGLQQGDGERPELPHGEHPGLPQGELPEVPEGEEEGEDPYWDGEWDRQYWDDPRWEGQQPWPWAPREWWDGQPWEEEIPVLLRMSTSSGLPSHSSERPTPIFGSSASGGTSRIKNFKDGKHDGSGNHVGP